MSADTTAERAEKLTFFYQKHPPSKPKSAAAIRKMVQKEEWRVLCGKLVAKYGEDPEEVSGGDAPVTIWACEGSGAGKETERGAWRQVGAGTLKEKQSTRLALSSPVAVGAGATVGLLVHAAKNYVRFSKDGEAGEVDASDGAISVLKGEWVRSAQLFRGASLGKDGDYHALAGSVEYKLAA